MKLALTCMLLIVAVAFAQAQQPAASAPPATQQNPAPPQKTISSYLGLHTFPAKNQTPTQQHQDEEGCYNWAKQDSNFDPISAMTAQQQAASPAPAKPNMPDTRGAGVAGAAGGAAKGAVAGAIAGDAGKGAEVGAAVGAMKGRTRARRAQASAQQQAQQQQQQQAQQQAQAKAKMQQNLDSFNKGFSACMEAKGYMVK